MSSHSDSFVASGSSPTPSKSGSEPDFSIEGEGRFCTVYLLRPLTPAAFEWIAEHIPEDAQRLGDAVAVEHRCVDQLLKAFLATGW